MDRRESLRTMLAAAAGSFASLNAKAAQPSAPFELGLNLSSVVYYSSELPFADLFKLSQWVSQAPGKPWGQGGELDLDANGWVRKLAPGQMAQAMFCGDTGTYFAGKQLTCTFDGQGDVEFLVAVRTTSRGPGRLTGTVNVKGKGLIFVSIKRTDPHDPIRNLRLIQPGLEDNKGLFSPAFLKRWSAFKVLRFMDWQKANNSPLVQWSDRATPDYYSQATTKGVCPEYMVELANVQGADPWFCMPHRASDDFVRQFAALVKKQLEPSRKVYIEYSNECWNPAFQQMFYCQKQGKDANLSTNAYEAQLRWYSQRAVEVFKIWEKEFGGTKRLVRVLSAQAANPWTGVTVMGWKDAYKNADAIAIAPYFGSEFGDPKSADKMASLSVDELLKECRRSIHERAKTTRRYADEARKRHLRLIAYEGGQHLVGVRGAENNERLTKLFQAANRAAAMKEVYLEDLKTWQECGGGLFCVFSSLGGPSKWGSWGILESEKQNPATAPKYQAFQELLIKRSRPTKSGSASRGID